MIWDVARTRSIPPTGLPADVRSIQASASQIPVQFGIEANARRRFCCGVACADGCAADAQPNAANIPIAAVMSRFAGRIVLSLGLGLAKRLAIRPDGGHEQSCA